MFEIVIKRLLRGMVSVLGVVTLVFFLVRWVPGDPVDAILGDQADPQDRAMLRASLKLDRPLVEQYQAFVRDVATGSLGTSFRKPVTVGVLIAEVFPSTLALAISALLMAWILAIPVGTLAAVQRGPWDHFAKSVAWFGGAIPALCLGPLLILVLSVKLHWLPLPGDDSASMEGLVLPAITLGAALSAVLVRHTRASVRSVLYQQYVLAARARGVRPTRLVLRHVLRNAISPVVTVGAIQIGGLLSGTVVAEKLFERRGIGSLFLDAFFARDIPVIQGCVLVVAMVVVMVHLAADMLQLWIQPQVRHADVG